MKILGIETSCDDTAIATINLAEDGCIKIIKNLKHTQLEHSKYGGVIPELASRLHEEKILKLLEQIGKEELKKIDLIAVAAYPGLPGSLIVGKTVANFLSKYFQKPIVKINHIWGHIASIFLERCKNDIKFPILISTASGGHSDLYLRENFEDLEKVKKLGNTLDDAAGEAFDKVSKLLGGPYPGGRRINKNAKKFRENPKIPNKVKKVLGEIKLGKYFKRVFLDKVNIQHYNFSFSGLKSQARNLVEKLKINLGTEKLDQGIINRISYEFEEVVVEILITKLLKAGKEFNTKTIAIAGGVSANQYFKQKLEEKGKENNFEIVYPKKLEYSTDNGAMIALAGGIIFGN